jgi:diguanylate cyclase (GGDEF)-like protein
MPEIAKHFERAEKLLHKGRHEAALNEYLLALQIDPGHERALQGAADLCLALGRGAEALKWLRQIFERQLANNQPAVVATYKKLLKLGSVSPEQTVLVARILEKTSRKEAVEAYRRALREFTASGRPAAAVGVLETIISLEPAVDDWEQLARLARQLHDIPKAVSALLHAGELKMPEDAAAALEIYQRAHALDVNHPEAALAYAHALLAEETPERGAQAAQVLQPFSSGPLANAATRASYGRALLVLDRAAEAEPFLREVFEQNPEEIGRVWGKIGELLDAQQPGPAVQLARRIEEHQQQAGRLREHAQALHDLLEKHVAPFEFLRYAADVFNASNRERDYCDTLVRLFDFYYADGNFLKAGECLDRAAEIDPYEEGHKARLELLATKIDSSRIRIIASRLLGAVTAGDAKLAETAQTSSGELDTAPVGGENEGPTTLQDLMLQAEIFLRYSLRSRAAERLERVRKLFPDEELKNEKLRELYAAAGLNPAANPSETAGIQPYPPSETQGAVDFTRLNEITKNISRQGSVKSVLFTAVNDAGRHWKASRCIAVLCSPGKPPSIALEYCAPGVQPSDVHGIVKLIALLQPLVLAHGPLALSGDSAAPHLAPLKHFAAGMKIGSLLAMPLMEADEHVGLLVLAHDDLARKWLASDIALLKSIADQSVLAVANVRLRRLVKNLAVTEEHSGLFKRSSYCDLLVAEVRRALRQNSPTTVLLVNFGKAAELVRRMGEAAVETMVEQLGQLVRSHVRQNDIAVRYDLTTLALVLGDTNSANAELAAEKLRRVLANSRVPSFTVGIAEAVMRAEFDPVDIVTELINRAEDALQMALGKGGHQVCVLPAEFSASARA